MEKLHSMRRHSQFEENYKWYILLFVKMFLTWELSAWDKKNISNLSHQRLNVKNPKKNFNFEKWLVGFTDGDGSFIIYKTKNTYNLAFKISQNKYNIRILYYIKKNIGVGSVNEEKNSNMAQYCVYSRQKLKDYIIPIFNKYPLLTIKYYNYERFKKAYHILEDKYLSQKQKNKLIENLILLKSNINFYISPINFVLWYSVLQNIEKFIYKEWLIGFIEAEGSFYISKNQLNYVYYFGICQKYDKHLLEGIKIILNLTNNTIYYNKKDKCYYLQTKNKQSIKHIINYVDGYLKGVKSLEFKLWKRAFNNNYNNNKLQKIQLIMRKLRKKNN